MTSLVTGGAGFIGSHVAEELIKIGEDVVVIDDLSGGYQDNIVDPRISFIHGSINDEILVKKIFEKHNFTYVFHLAAYAAEGLSHFIKSFNYSNNLLGTVNLLNAAVNYNIKKFIFTSSIAVYGELPPPMDEEMTPRPEDSYGIAKYAVELELRATKRMFDLDYVIFRPHNVYGERQNIGDRYRNVIGIFMNQILQEKPMTIFGDGEQLRAFTYISDVAPLIARAIQIPQASNQIFNIGADTPYTLNQLSLIVANAMNVPPNVIYLPERREVKYAFTKHQKINSIFQPPPQVSLEEGINRMAEWAKRVGSRESKNFSYIEIMKNLPPSWVEK
ncbi:MAG: NAD-dependent epimerase/dehydratase family protein [Anaerolineaceae bacterium]|nr:NAD-dependent epimerase/dehydratase family protein [Anaerolineaceae bacterium]